MGIKKYQVRNKLLIQENIKNKPFNRTGTRSKK
jgi:hypothetical protein